MVFSGHERKCVNPAEKARALRFQKEFLDRIGGGLQLSALFAHLPMVAFLAKDEQSRFVCANAPTLKIFNLEHEWEMLGKTDADFFSRPLAESFVEEDRRVMTSGETRTYYAQMVPDIAGPLNWYVVTVARCAMPAAASVASPSSSTTSTRSAAWRCPSRSSSRPCAISTPVSGSHHHGRARGPLPPFERQFTRVFRRLLGSRRCVTSSGSASTRPGTI